MRKLTDQSRYSVQISLFFGAIFLPVGIYIPYFAVWMKDLGLSAQDISLVLTVPLITRVIFTPIMAALADKFGDRRLTLRIYASLYALTFGLILLNNSLPWLVIVMVLSNLFMCAIIPVSDSLAMAGVRRFSLDYGRMRLWGSAAFIAGNLLGGLVIDLWSASHIIWLLVVANCLQVGFALLLPSDPRLEDGKNLTTGTRMDWQQLSQFAQISFWLILLSVALMQASHSLLYGFGTIYWQEVGVSSNMIGFFWAASVLAEIVLFTYSRHISSLINWNSLLILGAIGATIRWWGMAQDLSDFGYMLLQLLHALSFAASHLGIIFFIGEVVEDELSGTAQGLYTMLSGLCMAVATYLSGGVYEQFGGQAFLMMGGISLVALGLLFAARLFSLKTIVAE